MKLLLTVVLCFYVSHTLYCVTPEPSSRRLSSLHSKINYNKKQINQKKQRAKNYVSHLGSLKRDLRIQQRKLYSQNKRLHYYQKKTHQTKQKLSQTHSDYTLASDALSSRLVHVYKHQHLGSFSFLLAPKDYSTALGQSYYFDKVFQTDISIVQSLNQTYQRYHHQKKTYLRQQSKIKSLTNSIQSRKKTLTKQSNRVSRKLTLLQKEIAAFEKRNTLLKRDSKHIGNMIRKQPKPKRHRYYGNRYYIKPSKGWLSSRYGHRRHPIFRRMIFHRGIDIAAPNGRPIRSSNNGYVVFSGWQKGYGRVTIIDHGFKQYNRYSSVYAHQSRILVRKGQYIRQNQLIGYVGSSGYATGPHLHFEMRKNGTPVDPLKYFKI